MRKLMCLLALGGAVLAIPTAGAAGDPGVSLSASTLRVEYGSPVRLSGVVTTHASGVPVSIVARSFTRSGFTQIAQLTTGAGGRWNTSVEPKIATTYVAKVGSNASRPLLVGVRPALSIRSLGDGRLVVHAEAAQAFKGRAVKLQRLASGSWRTVAKLTLNGRSSAAVPAAALPFGASKLRAAMSVNQAGLGYLGSYSTTVALPARWVSAALSRIEIPYGDSIRLAGRTSIKQAGLGLTILARPLAKPEFRRLATVQTGAGGRWSIRLTPKVGTAYQAEFRQAKSHVVAVGIHPTIRTRIVSGARVFVHVVSGRSLGGRDVRIQQLSNGRWVNVAKAKLNRRSQAVVPVTSLPGGVSTLRVTMSVNQVGLGYLGAVGNSFLYQR
jgi:hypothetical protein